MSRCKEGLDPYRDRRVGLSGANWCSRERGAWTRACMGHCMGPYLGHPLDGELRRRAMDGHQGVRDCLTAQRLKHLEEGLHGTHG
jgi:hypothetical protein